LFPAIFPNPFTDAATVIRIFSHYHEKTEIHNAKTGPVSREAGFRAMRKKTPEDQSVNCRQCRHFFITYDPRFPYGCRVIGFKSRDLPSVVVCRDSGAACRSYTLRKKK